MVLAMTAAARQRRTRARHRQGLTSMRIDVHEDNFARALINSRRLTPDETLRRRLLERELQHLIEDFIDRWPDGHA
jgi:hypothetical protein